MSSKKISVVADQYQLDQKYRPQTVDEIILPKEFKKTFKSYIKKGFIPHLLFHSSEPGTGKTTTARAIVNDLGLDPNTDYLFLRGDDVNMSFVKNELYTFCANASPTGKRRVVIIDEYDRSTLGEAHKAMRGVVDDFSDSVSFIITANDPFNIHEALRNRMMTFNFGLISQEDKESMQVEFKERMLKICELEGIEVTDGKLISYIIHKHFPFFRTCLTDLSKYAFANDNVFDNGYLMKVLTKERSTNDIVALLKSDRINRDQLMAVAKENSYNAQLFVNNLYIDVSKQVSDAYHDNLIKIIGEMNKTWGLACNKDLHLFYLLYQIASTASWKND